MEDFWKLFLESLRDGSYYTWLHEKISHIEDQRYIESNLRPRVSKKVAQLSEKYDWQNHTNIPNASESMPVNHEPKENIGFNLGRTIWTMNLHGLPKGCTWLDNPIGTSEVPSGDISILIKNQHEKVIAYIQLQTIEPWIRILKGIALHLSHNSIAGIINILSRCEEFKIPSDDTILVDFLHYIQESIDACEFTPYYAIYEKLAPPCQFS